MINKLNKKSWWAYMEDDIQELLKESYMLIDSVIGWEQSFSDYSFIVFPAAKAYEGFLKRLFYDLDLISKRDYLGKRFRIGKALNPSLDRKRYKGESVYDKLIEHCSGEDLAKHLWKTWKTCRNRLFHWFPEEKQAISYEEAKARVERIINSIDMAFEDCVIDKNKETDIMTNH